LSKIAVFKKTSHRDRIPFVDPSSPYTRSGNKHVYPFRLLRRRITRKEANGREAR